MNDNQVVQADKQFAQTSKEKGLIKSYKQFLAEDAVFLPHNHPPQYGLANIIQFLSRHGTNYDMHWTPQAGLVAQSEDLGYTWGTYQLHVKDDQGEAIDTETGKYLNVWSKIKDEWKVIVDMGNLSPA